MQTNNEHLDSTYSSLKTIHERVERQASILDANFRKIEAQLSSKNFRFELAKIAINTDSVSSELNINMVKPDLVTASSLAIL